MRRIFFLCGLGLCSVLVLAGAARTSPSFQFTSIDFPGAVLTNVQGINPGGEMVGFYRDTAQPHLILQRQGNAGLRPLIACL